MDAFKPDEIKRLELGGNKRWIEFWEGHEEGGKRGGVKWGRPGEGGDDAAAKELERRYGGVVGSEWKERLACEVEGREFTGMPAPVLKKKAGGSSQFEGGAGGSRTASPAGMGPKSQKELNESFFAKKGNENASRPEGVAPSQGGKYGGFGGGGVEPAERSGGGAGIDDFQKDPVAALSKGLGWFAGAVGQGAKGGYEGWIRPGVAKVGFAFSSYLVSLGVVLLLLLLLLS